MAARMVCISVYVHWSLLPVVLLMVLLMIGLLEDYWKQGIVPLMFYPMLHFDQWGCLYDLEVELNNEVITPNGPCVISATKNIIQVKAQGKLRFSNLPTKTTIEHKIPVAQNLLSLSVQANNNIISILDNKKIIICKEDAMYISLNKPPVITGRRASIWLWKVPIVQQSAPRINLDTYYHPKIANSVVPTFNNKFLWNIPLPTAAWSQQEQQEEPLIYCALPVYTQPTLEALAIYLHSCAG